MERQNRIVGNGETDIDDILFNPENWRVHSKSQQKALKGVMEKIGWVQQVIVNETTGNLVDGHLRVQMASREGLKKVPVVYVKLTPAEEKAILATYDPIAQMAIADKDKLDELLLDCEFDPDFLETIRRDFGLYKPEEVDFKDIPDLDGFEEPQEGVRAIIEFDNIQESEEFMRNLGFDWSPYKIRYHVRELGE